MTELFDPAGDSGEAPAGATYGASTGAPGAPVEAGLDSTVMVPVSTMAVVMGVAAEAA